MAFVKRTWLARLGTGLNKFIIGEKDAQDKQTLTNSPDSITQDGDTISAQNLNDLEDRIEAGFNEKQDTLTFDNVPTEGSTNPVTSGGVYNAVATKVPTTRTINGKALSSNITLTASDVGAVNAEDTGWINFYAPYSYRYIKYRKKNGYVTIIGKDIESLSTSTGYLPSDFRPAFDINLICYSTNNFGILTDYRQCRLYADGHFSMQSNNTAGDFIVTYPV